jgi:hypothetical protein
LLNLVPKSEVSFDQFWSIYPRRVAKKAALTAWNRLSDVQQRLALYALPNHVKATVQVQENIDRMIASGSRVQYPMSRRKEDWSQIYAARPRTFWRVGGTHRTSGCTWRTRTAMVVHRHERVLNARFKDLLSA